MNMDGLPRIPPGSACQACRRLKMKCTRQPGSPSCMRCEKNGRACTTVLNRPAASKSQRQTRTSPITHSPHLANSTVGPSVSALVGSADTVESSGPMLPSIYSISPVASHVDRDHPRANSPCSENRGQVSNAATLGVLSGGERLSAEDTAQLIEFFRERLLVALPIFIPTDFLNVADLIIHSPYLVSCIAYVTARYIPGYQEVRKALTPTVLHFLQVAHTTKIRDEADELAMMRALIILCVFTRWSVVDKEPETHSSTEISFWHVKTTSEAFAMRINLHRSADGMKRQLQTGKPPNRSDACTNKYLYWLWLYTQSHHGSIVTGTPPSLPVDASIRVVSQLLKCFESDEGVSFLLAEVQLCLLWDKLGAKDISLKEWWCSADLQTLHNDSTSSVTVDDVDAALQNWKTQLPTNVFSNSQEGILSLSTDYFFHYTRFCLNTHFIRHIYSNDLRQDEIQNVHRSMDSAISVLKLSRNVGPLRRDQLRYSSGFLYITICFCSTFIVQAIRKFPALFPNPTEELNLLRKTAAFITDLGLDKGYGTRATGQSIIRQVDATIELTNPRHYRPVSPMNEPRDVVATTAYTAELAGQPTLGVERALDTMWDVDINDPIFDTILEFPVFFETYDR